MSYKAPTATDQVTRRFVDREINRADTNVHMKHAVFDRRRIRVRPGSANVSWHYTTNDEGIRISLNGHGSLGLLAADPGSKKFLATLTAASERKSTAD
ncbi:hypothetical protein [Novosphingobium sp. ST904]|uniref:hypothetical protein n=1 Tax=Novosphingobium sp. ST904 TaxID=1684385 RepID=UPI0006C8DE8D|nr:hypothetical protein [Novosphingobium sp. ST904]KPH66089.1 hypothetical protein ADT71_08395 [Novosphingobium sp. ST904]